MEELNKIIKWISGSGDGSGDGYGSGYGDGSGYGSGSGDGFGDGSGYGSGYGDGSGDGSGYGDGSGDGYGDGSGDGSGDGYGDGSGDGSGYGDGSGDGYGIQIKQIGSEQVFYVDGIPTIITHIRNNIAKGFIIDEMIFDQKPCYIAKVNYCFAHETTIEQALATARSKSFKKLNIEERIKEFVETFKPNKKYKGQEFFDWHNILTGSCLLGRNSFMNSRGYSFDKEYTVQEFITACENDFGGEIIRELKKYYK